MITACIIDDEYEAVRGLGAMLDMFCPGVEVIGTAGSVAQGIDLFQHHTPSLLFLDIEMKDGSGFDLLEKMPSHNCCIIFVTAFDQYAIRALKLNALDYLLKPVDPDELINAVERAAKMQQHNRYPEYKHLVEGIREGSFKKIGVPVTRGTMYIDLSEIIRLESDNNYTYIFTRPGNKLLVTKTIKSFESTLPEHTFIRCHQRHIVNMDHVKEYDKTEGGSLVLGEHHIPISRGNRARVEKMLQEKYPRI